MPDNFFANKYKKTSETIRSDGNNGKKTQPVIKKAVFEKLPESERAFVSPSGNIPAPKKEAKKFVFKKIEEVIAEEESRQKKQKPHYDSLGVLSKKKLAAMFLICADMRKSAEVISEFSLDELIKISEEILAIGYVTREDLEQVEKNFGSQNVKDIGSLKGGKEFLRTLLQNAFGIDKGSQIFMQILEKTDDKSFSFLHNVSTENILKLISDESSLVISFVLGRLPPNQAAGILKQLPKDQITQIIRYMSDKTEINSDVLDIIAKKMKEKTKQIISKDDNSIQIGGKNKLADILKHIDAENAEMLINDIGTNMPDLAQEIKDMIFTFSDIPSLKKTDLELALREWQNSDIALMLKSTPKELRASFFVCMSHRRAEEIVEQIKLLGEVKKTDVLEKQQAFVRYLRELEEAGRISLFPDNEEYVN